MHNCRYGKVIPVTNSGFWQKKRESNVARDKRNLKELKMQGRKVLVIWECQTKNPQKLMNRIVTFLNSGKKKVVSNILKDKR